MEHVLGTAIKITTILDDSTPSTVKISIYNPSNVLVVTEASMIAESGANSVYYYIYQSSENDLEGDYIFAIKVEKGAYTSVAQKIATFMYGAWISR